MTLRDREFELKKRLHYDYLWSKKQNDEDDSRTDFIYGVSTFDRLLLVLQLAGLKDCDHLFNYALNRWYNFWSAQAVEEIFCSLNNVRPAVDARNRLVDFTIDNITFDHKTSVFPKRFPGDLRYALANPRKLIAWLYREQSQQRRKHLKNRLFIVVHSSNGEHWKLKAEVLWLKGLIEAYARDFQAGRLHQFRFEPHSVTLSDIIWAKG